MRTSLIGASDGRPKREDLTLHLRGDVPRILPPLNLANALLGQVGEVTGEGYAEEAQACEQNGEASQEHAFLRQLSRLAMPLLHTVADAISSSDAHKPVQQ